MAERLKLIEPNKFIEKIDSYYIRNADNAKIILEFKRLQREVLTKINTEKSLQNPDQEKIENYKAELMKITQDVLDFRSIRIERDSKTLEKTRRNLVKSNQGSVILAKTIDLLKDIDL